MNMQSLTIDWLLWKRDI